MSDVESDKGSLESVEDIIEIRPIQPSRRNLNHLELNSDHLAMSGPGRITELDITQGTRNAFQQRRPVPNRRVMNQNTPRQIPNDDNNFPPVIPLNVGGVKYMTRLSTLTKYSDSMLAALFSGRHNVDKDEYGNYFLDSNGTLFGYILEFLRNGSLPPNQVAVSCYKEANYYGIEPLTEKLQLKPEVASLQVREAHRHQFPNYYEIKDRIVQLSIENAVCTRTGEVIIYAFRNEFVPKVPNFNPKHGCVVESAQISIGPWTGQVDEEVFMRCLENDLMEEGFNVRPHESKRKCRYFHGQTCQKFVYRLQIVF